MVCDVRGSREQNAGHPALTEKAATRNSESPRKSPHVLTNSVQVF